MTLKQKSLFSSVITILIGILAISIVFFQVIMVQFQKVENQRAERNIHSISAILEDRLNQLNTKLADWTIWDDTYYFLQDGNKDYIESNLTQEGFASSEIEEALFIDKKGRLVADFLLEKMTVKEIDFPENILGYFATGSSLLKINKETSFNKGILETDNGVLLFAVREVVKSNGQGEPAGYVVFSRYLEEKILNSMKELTQFETRMFLWNDNLMTSDFLSVKNDYQDNPNKTFIKILNKETISGYLVVKDVFEKPVAIIRTDVVRDITAQGRSSMILLLSFLGGIGIIIIIINFVLLTSMVLKKVLQISSEVDTLAKSGITQSRLKIGKDSDEVDKLRQEINNMLDSVQKSKTELQVEKQKGEFLIDLIDAIIVNLDGQGRVLLINKKGLDMLGYKNEEVVGKEWITTFVSLKSQDTINKTFNSLMSDKFQNNSQIENEIVSKDGKVLLVSWRNTIIKDNQGKVISTLSLGEDITDKKEELKKKEDYAKQLEEMNKIMVGRELKMIELKNQISKLSKK